ncbi:MAG: fimbrial assembly protein [Mesorhizobium sp.]|uniref:PilN domain-containing protein n=1 Tax=Mesorhizobium sp. TaxID=1871066 RepID=UPI000FE510A6|nr:PilN domain-containing protein [Mesorhizobium sp.]RWD47027.1 MAG: fimbrial assembly protein [Mesorhizobium sp.]RWE52187.1 MAG: fimbrial assembly protein [Mesorhizobium sp.]RWF11051.1 MAG: fimbrial assembly protein [Mesorhizobium sp.]RWF20877.1 MAG: fimbrial assembly protein [Mesorhizobium sp.]
MATLKTEFLDFLDWWLDELRGVWTRLVPQQERSSTGDWIVSLADDGIRARAPNASEFQSIPLTLNASADEVLALLQTGLRRKRPTFDVVIQPGLFLTRQLAARRLPLRQARTMAELDLLASTPIDPAQVHVVFAQHLEHGCSYHVVKSKTLAAVLDAIRRVGGTVDSLSFVNPDRTRLADQLSLAAIWPPTKRNRRTRTTWVTACSILFGTALVTFGHAQWRYWQAGTELDAQIADAQIHAKAARSSLQKRQTGIEQVERIRNEKKTSASLVRVWAELTGLLPDTAWLTDLSSKGGELTITGFSTSAAELIGPLNASPLFAAPEFAAPVVKVPGQDGERFTVTAKIGAL